MRVHKEIQNMHWHNHQVSILVHISYKKNFLYGYLGDESIVIKEVHYYVSDDTTHDTLFIQHVFMLHWSHLKDQGYSPKFHFV
jgi:hypothetical protein